LHDAPVGKTPQPNGQFFPGLDRFSLLNAGKILLVEDDQVFLVLLEGRSVRGQWRRGRSLAALMSNNYTVSSGRCKEKAAARAV
jgi:hypothetical protein